jgi:cathepsin L
MNSIVFALFCLLGLQISLLSAFRSEAEYETLFENWIQEHGKSYDEHELLYRFRVFKKNVDFIEEFNANSELNGFYVGLNKFADLTNSEFMERYSGFNSRLVKVQDPDHVFEYDQTQALPSSVDWRTKGAVTAVKDQGQCGSCWSFSTTGSVEGAWALNYSLVSLSEQNLMDCSRSYGNMGCNGGLMDNAFKYIINNKGIDTEASYPYEEATSYNCRYKSTNLGAKISSYKDVTSGSESALQNAVAYHGPVSVAIDASHMSFQMYKGGVYYESRCSSTQLDHGVLVVGYGTGSSGDYWIVKNSWGTSWGDQGYIYMARNKNNNCGIATQASFPIV